MTTLGSFFSTTFNHSKVYSIHHTFFLSQCSYIFSSFLLGMPEAPEVAYLTHYLHTHVKGKRISSVNIAKGRYVTHGAPDHFHAFVNDLPMTLQKVEKKGKVILLHFSKGWHIVSKLGLTGWWYVSGSQPNWLKGSHNIEFTFGAHKSLMYHDTLSYGTLTFTQSAEFVHKQMERLAPDVSTIRLEQLLDRIENKHMSQKQMEDVLLDQTAIVSGIGNYMRSEILYEAKISPKRRIDSLSKPDWIRFLEAAQKVHRRSLQAMQKDRYKDAMQVYKRKEDVKGNVVEKYTSPRNHRTVYWVPSLQK